MALQKIIYKRLNSTNFSLGLLHLIVLADFPGFRKKKHKKQKLEL